MTTNLNFGELRSPDDRLTLAETHERLFTAPGDPLRQVSQDEVASLLEELGYEWLQPDDLNQWKAVATGPRGCRCNLTATIVQGGVDVCGPVLATEASLAEASKSALVQFLAAAHGRIRFARFTLQDRKLHAVSFAAADRLDVELADSVTAVVTACGLVWREVSALTDTAVAEAYLESMH